MGTDKQNWTVYWRIGQTHGSDEVETDTAKEASNAVKKIVAVRKWGMEERKSSVVILSIGLTPTKIAA